MLLLDQLISLAGAAMVLAAYLGLQRGWMRREDRGHNALGLLGSM